MSKLGWTAIVLAFVAAQAAAAPSLHDEALELLKRGVAFRTVAGAGNQTPGYATYLKGYLTAAGYRPDEVTIEPFKDTAILIARYPGKDRTKKPIVISGHMDVVEARRQDWTRDPFTPVVEGGFVYGRGAYDNKFDVSMEVAVLAKLRRAGWRPGRDVVLALSGDEETDEATDALLAERLKDAELVLNGDGGGGALKDGKPLPYGVQGAEKTYADFVVTFTDAGGHSSRPTPGNAINRLAHALDRVEAYRFPVQTNEITRAALAAEGAATPGPLGESLRRFAANPEDAVAVATLSRNLDYAPQIRTTCVVTLISGGHADNALPQRASATLNCRIFPGTPPEDVRRALVTAIADPAAEVVRGPDGGLDAPASPVRADVMAAVTKAVHARYPGLAVTPSQDVGASNSVFFRALGVPAYGVSSVIMEQGQHFAHGLNEKAPVGDIDGALLHWETLIRELAK